MKYETEFREYLYSYVSPKTGKLINRRVATDAISRCKKIERVFHIELSPKIINSDGFIDMISLEIKSLGEDFCSGKYGYGAFVYGLRLYSFFSRELRKKS